jgi:hypothetical protein
LPDNHFRSFVTSLVWSVTNRTDGVIEPEDLELIPRFATDSVRNLLAAGLWEPRGGSGRGWQIIDFAATQTTAVQLRHLEDNRAKEREKRARQRAARRGEDTSSASTDAAVLRDIPRDVPPDDTGKDRTGKDRTGKDRTGKDRQGEGESLPMAAGAEQLTWRGAGPDPYAEYK